MRALRALALVTLVVALAGAGVFAYYYVQFSRLLDARLADGLARSAPRVYGRPFELRRGQQLTQDEVIERLDDLGYSLRSRVDAPGEFAIGQRSVAFVARSGQWQGKTIRVVFAAPPKRQRGAPAAVPGRVERVEVAGGGEIETVTMEAPMLSALVAPGREKRRRVPLASIPTHVRDAVLAIEDRRFFDHPGVDIVRTLGAIRTNLKGEKKYLEGGSTITQQFVKNILLTPEKSYARKLREQMLAIILERRLGKEKVLELYLNEVYLGQRGSFAVHGVPEAARLYFGKHVSNLTVPEAATLAGMIQAPPVYSPLRNPERCTERRNLVLREMATAGYLSADAATRASQAPLVTATLAVDDEAPYFVDEIGAIFADQYPALALTDDVELHTTLDLHLQRIAQQAVIEGLGKVETQLRRKRRGRPQAALIAIDPRTGDVLAYVGGRSYGQSQFNRVAHARRQPGSVFKPFVYLAAFEHAAALGRRDITPATIVIDEPTTFYDGVEEWTPRNYQGEYSGPITLRRALALSRNVATARVAEMTGYGEIARLWRRLGTATAPHAYPAISLGVFEATPWEIAEAYTVFANGGETRPLQTIRRVSAHGHEYAPPRGRPVQRIARDDTTYLVTSMMRSVINEGTGAGVRAAGFAFDAAGKTGTTNDLRDAWFVGFTPELLTVVWVGYDDNQAVGLSGSQAALPIWTSFMKKALSGHANVPFPAPPPGIIFAEIDRDSGKLATPQCERTITEAFLIGTEPFEMCDQHGTGLAWPFLTSAATH
ncbi:MAG: PBP1A family penicillin-binding protein [Vicinamibacteraceae bacterium]|nr:PBP1A family penicillin-binding protein [Vicinamibacteraceae bacterium]